MLFFPKTTFSKLKTKVEIIILGEQIWTCVESNRAHRNYRVLVQNFRCSQILATSSATSAPSTLVLALTRVLSVARLSPHRQASSSTSTSTAVSNLLSVSGSLCSQVWTILHVILTFTFQCFSYLGDSVLLSPQLCVWDEFFFFCFH